MSEITAEHVAEALALAQRGGFEDKQGAGHLMQARKWSQHVPDYVKRAWLARGLGTYITALTRWHAELVAAETPRKVARWDDDAGVYRLTPPYTHPYAYLGITTKRENALAWGYEIEGGPEPVRDWKSDRAIAAIWPTPKPVVHIGVDLANGPDWTAEHVIDDSPERLRERREGIPWTLNEAAAAVSKTPSNLNGGCVPWQAADVSLCEGKPFAGPAYAQCRALYAAALSAEEERRAAVGAWAAGGGVLHYSPPTEPERPAPRFKVGDVPQLEPWHARLVRLASDVAVASKAHDEAQAEREAAERRADAAWKALRTADHALRDATEAAAILTAATATKEDL